MANTPACKHVSFNVTTPSEPATMALIDLLHHLRFDTSSPQSSQWEAPTPQAQPKAPNKAQIPQTRALCTDVTFEPKNHFSALSAKVPDRRGHSPY